MIKNSPESGRGGWTQLSRYRQEPDKAPRMRLQPRDGEIISAVHKYRLITTEGILKLFAPGGRGDKALRRRLALLFHHHFLIRRYLYPLDRPLGLGSSKAVYLLDTEGARHLWGDNWWRGGEGKKLERRKEYGYQFRKHALSISEFQLALDLALKEREGCSLESFAADVEDTRAKIQVRIPRYSVRKNVPDRKGGGEQVTVWPDAAFTIITPAARQFYFLEVDHADRKEERIFKRFLAYWQYVVMERDRLRQKRGVSGAFVIFASPDAKRRKTLIEIASRVPEIRRRRPGFWFLNLEDCSLLDPSRLLKEFIVLGLDGNPGLLTKF